MRLRIRHSRASRAFGGHATARRRRRTVIQIGLAILVGAIALVPQFSGAAPRDNEPPTLVLNPSAASVGATVVASGSNLGFKQAGELKFDGSTVARFTTGAKGRFIASFVVSHSDADGMVPVSATTPSVSLVTMLRVVGPSTPPTASTSTTRAPTTTTAASPSTTTTLAPPKTTTTLTPTTPPPVGTGFGLSWGRPFAPSSGWNPSIAASPVLDANSAAQVAFLANGTSHVADLHEFGVPVWDANASTPRYSVSCTMSWGQCPFAGIQVPIPSGAVASSGSDGAMVVIDWSAARMYEFWQYRWNSGRPTTGWGAVGPYTGEGRDGEAGRVGNSTGAGISRLAGVVRTWEIAQGRIDHALVFSTNNACASTLRYPAVKSDGRSTRGDCVPEGARLQLDPSVNVDALAISPAEKTVARALQTYGAYVIDNGGANMAFIFETPSGEADPYCGKGLCSDYQRLNLPWNKLRVLRNWTGT